MPHDMTTARAIDGKTYSTPQADAIRTRRDREKRKVCKTQNRKN